MARRRVNPQARISTPQAERAIYVDCEGFEGKSPALIGIQIGDDPPEQVVLDPALELVAEACDHRLSTFQAEAGRILERSETDDRMIVSYSQHEREIFQAFADTDIGSRYKDARMIAKRWRNTLHREIPLSGRGVKDFLEIVGYARGKYLGDRKTTKRLRAVRDMLSRRGSYEALTPVVKAQWTKLLEHNRIDCDGMRYLVLKCARELEESGQ